MLPGLHMESQLFQTAEGSSLSPIQSLHAAAWHYLSTSEKLSWSHAAIQLRLVYKQRYDSSWNISLCSYGMCTHTNTRQHEVSRGLFSQLRWAESGRIERNRERGEERLALGFAWVCSVICLPAATWENTAEGWQTSIKSRVNGV